MAKKSAAPSKLQENLKELCGLTFFLVSLFVFISLVTYTPGDISGIKYPPNDPVHNRGGSIGAGISYFLFHNFGVASFVLIFFVGFWSALIFFRRPVHALYLKLISAIIAIFSVATLFSMQSIASFGLTQTAPGAGGVYGEAFELILTRALGYPGALLAVILAMSISLVLATNWQLYLLVQKAFGWMKRGGAWMFRHLLAAYGRWREKRNRLAEACRQQEIGRMIEEERKRLELEDKHEQAMAPAAERVGAPAVVDETPETEEDAVAPPVREAKPKTAYRHPPIDLFEDKVERLHTLNEKDIKERMLVIEKTLADFDITARVVNYETGPTVTIYELELAAGTRYAKLVALADDLAIALKAPNVRVVAPLPGKSTVGVEVPNPFPDVVRMREFLKSGLDDLRKTPLPLFLGKTNGGATIVKSLTEMPHLLVAGTTGSGKSVCLNTIISGLLVTMTPDEMKLLLVDPKMVELSAFKDVPHLWAPVITDMKKAPAILDWLVKEMEDRYVLLSRAQVKKIEGYNQLGEEKIRERLSEDGELPEGVPFRLPYIVVVVDELADLMMTAAKEVESTITRLAQKSRAVGIHLVLATQRPSVDVITGLIKSNMPSRVAFKVAAKVDSRTILDQNGAERLLGKGDMLLMFPGAFALTRAQCTFVSDKEIRDVVQFLSKQGEAVFHQELVEMDGEIDFNGTDKDDLFEEAVRIVVESQRGSVSLLQRHLGIGYTRAARMVDNMAKMGIVGEYKGSNARDVLLTLEQWESRKAVAGKS